MLHKLNIWLDSVFRNSDINKLLAVIVGIAAFLWFFAGEAAPLFGGLLIAYLLEGGVQKLQRQRISRTIASALVVMLMATIVLLLLYLLPLFALQLKGATKALPNLTDTVAAAASWLNEYMPAGTVLDKEEINVGLSEAATTAGGLLLDNLPGAVGNVFALVLYLVLLPLLVFFVLKDKDTLLRFVQRHVPVTPIFGELWASVDEQFGSYVRGKFIEAAIIGILSWAAFKYFGLNYAFSLATLIGLSVFVPFVGAILVTVPVLALAYIQFGMDAAFFWVVGWYAAIQIFDGQLLVPLLFSEVVKLHPVAIFVAIIFFGNLWGVVGVFFAIPLASLIKSLILVIDARRTV